MGQQKPAPMVALLCEAKLSGDLDTEALCAAMLEALQDARPQEIVRQISPEAEATLQPGDRLVVLHIDLFQRDAVAGHLAWRTISDPVSGQAEQTMTVGPQSRLDVMDATLTVARYPHFAAGLIRVSKLFEDK